MIPIISEQLPFRRLGVVIPVYGHARLVVEAVESACAQEIGVPVSIVIVDDGCPSTETQAAITAARMRHQGQLFSLRQKNGGLSAARNLGIRTLLALHPDLDAIFFLDADNRLEPYALQAHALALADQPSAGWAFPDIHAFGLSPFVEGLDTRETAARDSVFRHLRGNICEAGSLVRTEVFKGGVFFDETMRQGFEDWDFWLSAREAGWHGVRVKDSGFLYRVRPESMVAQSRRQTEAILSGMRNKHQRLFSRRAVLAAEHVEAPRFLIADLAAGTLKATSDPLQAGEPLSLRETRDRFARHLADIVECDFPDLVIAHHGLTREPEFSPFWRSLLFEVLDRRIVTPSLICLEHSHEASRAGDDPREARRLIKSATGIVAILPVNQLYKLNTERPRRAGASFLRDVDRVERWGVPMANPVGQRAEGDLRTDRLSALLRPLVRGRPPARFAHASRLYRGPKPRDARMLVTDALCSFGHYQTWPHVGARTNRCLLAAAPANLDTGAKRAAFAAFAATLRDGGLELTLCLDGRSRRAILDTAIAASGATNVLIDPNDPPAAAVFGYRGEDLPVSNPATQTRLMALAKGHDVLACFGQTQFLPICGEAKGEGILTILGFFESLSEGPGDPVTKLAAYEHAHHFIATDAEAAGLLALQGVPVQRMVDLDTLPDAIGRAVAT